MTIEAEAGENIWRFIGRVRKYTIDSGIVSVECKFNGIELLVYPESHINDLVEIYGLKARIQRMQKHRVSY